jgi:hypothetical protein
MLLFTTSEWSLWAEQFPSCDPVKNPNLSPINIETSKASLDKDGQALIVYSGEPIPSGGYTFNSRFLNEGKVTIEAG